MNNERPFAILARSLTEFQGAVSGEPGESIKSIDGKTGIIPDIVRKVLDGLYEILKWFDEQVDILIPYMQSLDSGMALIEIGGDIFTALGELEISPLFEQMNIDSAPIEHVQNVAGFTGETIGMLGKFAQIIPSPEELDSLNNQLEALLGNKEKGMKGGLIELIKEIKVKA